MGCTVLFPKRYAIVLISCIRMWLVWGWRLYRSNQVKMRWSGWVYSDMAGVRIRGNLDTDSHIGRLPRERENGHLLAKEASLKLSPSQLSEDPLCQHFVSEF